MYLELSDSSDIWQVPWQHFIKVFEKLQSDAVILTIIVKPLI